MHVNPTHHYRTSPRTHMQQRDIQDLLREPQPTYTPIPHTTQHIKLLHKWGREQYLCGENDALLTAEREWPTPMSQEEERNAPKPRPNLDDKLQSILNSTFVEFRKLVPILPAEIACTNKQTNSLVCLSVCLSSTCAKSKEEYDVCAQCEYDGTQNLGNVAREV